MTVTHWNFAFSWSFVTFYPVAQIKDEVPPRPAFEALVDADPPKYVKAAFSFFTLIWNVSGAHEFGIHDGTQKMIAERYKRLFGETTNLSTAWQGRKFYLDKCCDDPTPKISKPTDQPTPFCMIAALQDQDEKEIIEQVDRYFPPKRGTRNVNLTRHHQRLRLSILLIRACTEYSRLEWLDA